MLEIGSSASLTRKVNESDVIAFADITGDNNPIHLDEEEAKKTVFKSRVVHGMLTASFISAILGTKLPGPGTIYLEQSLKFKKPVYVNDTVYVQVTVSDIINEEKGIYRLDTIIKNSIGEIVTEGYAVVKA